MPWFKVDDKLHSHVKAARAGLEAMGLWTIAGSWSMDQLTDGFVPDYIAARLHPKAKRLAAALVKAGLWDEAEKDGDTGWQFHDWDEYQPTRDETEAKREAERERKRAWRAKEAPRHHPGRRRAAREHGPDPVRTTRVWAAVVRLPVLLRRHAHVAKARAPRPRMVRRDRRRRRQLRGRRG